MNTKDGGNADEVPSASDTEQEKLPMLIGRFGKALQSASKVGSEEVKMALT